MSDGGLGEGGEAKLTQAPVRREPRHFVTYHASPITSIITLCPPA